jgi:ubiquitin conjugation factor E4 B
LSILGPFLGRTGFFPDNDPHLVQKIFPSNGGYTENLYDSDRGIGDRNRGDVTSTQNSLRESFYMVQTNLYDIFMSLIKSGPSAKEGVLNYIAKAIELNSKRGQMQVDKKLVCSDGFIHNLLQVCKRLCEPIYLDHSFSKLSLIDLNYFLKYDRIDISHDTRVNTDLETALEIGRQLKMTSKIESPNFVSDIFFLCGALHHYGLLSNIRFYKNFVKELNEMQKNGLRFQKSRDRGDWNNLNPMTRSTNEAGLQRLQNELDRLLGAKLAIETTIMDKVMLEQSISFYNLVMMWIIKVVSGTTGNIQWAVVASGNALQTDLFPIKHESKVFITLPEWIIEDLCEFYLFLMRYNAPIFENQPRNEFMTFSIVMLSNSELIKNPYLKSKLVEVNYC